MKNSLYLKIIFYTLVIAVALGTGIVLDRNFISPASNNQPTQNTNQLQPTANSCIITVDGQHYDVTSLRNTHTGGDVFQCGTDMSAVFHGQHGNNLRLIQRYLVP